MNGTRAIKAAGTAGSLLVRHFLAFAGSTGAACALWTLVYVALLIWAVLSNNGVGGPLAYPAGLIFVVAASSFCCLVLLLPSTLAAEWIARRLRLSVLLQIPISAGFLAVFSLLLVGMGQAARLSGVEEISHKIPALSGLLFLLMLLPLGVYWWIAQSVPLTIALVRTLRHLFSPQKPRH